MEACKGGWKSGVADGRCVIAYADGSRYEGEVRDGQKSGHGTLVYADGSLQKGEWKDGEFIGGQGTGPSTNRKR